MLVCCIKKKEEKRKKEKKKRWMVNISITFAGVTNLIDYRRVMKAGFSDFFVSRVLHIILFARLSV